MNIATTERSKTAARSLQDKVSLITGSTSGIGLGIARALAGAGSAVIINGFGKPEDIDAEQAAIKKDFGVRVAYSPADMSDPTSIEGMIKTALKNFGHIDIVVNNAGIQHVAPVEDFPAEKWDQVIAINLSSSFHTVRAAVPAMKANGGASSTSPRRTG